jgi:hypothetical protein
MRLFTQTLISLLILFGTTVAQSESDSGPAAARDTLSSGLPLKLVEGLSAEDYFAVKDGIEKGTSEDYLTLRLAYTKTKDYCPYGNDYGDSLKAAKSLLNDSAFQSALKPIGYVMEHEFTNIEAHMLAAFTHHKLGDSTRSRFHAAVYRGLLESVRLCGDGGSAETSYTVISTDEEYSLVRWLGLKSNGQTLVTSEGHSYDVIATVDPESEEEGAMFFNIDLLFQALDRLLQATDSASSE